MSATIKVETTTEERSDVQAARAAPVSLPAGSFDSADLQRSLDEAAKAKNDGKRDELVAEAILANYNPGTEHAADAGLSPGYKRVEVDVIDLGITENRIVFDPSKADEAQAAQADAPKVIQSGAVDLPGAKGE